MGAAKVTRHFPEYWVIDNGPAVFTVQELYDALGRVIEDGGGSASIGQGSFHIYGNTASREVPPASGVDKV